MGYSKDSGVGRWGRVRDDPGRDAPEECEIQPGQEHPFPASFLFGGNLVGHATLPDGGCLWKYSGGVED